MTRGAPTWTGFPTSPCVYRLPRVPTVHDFWGNNHFDDTYFANGKPSDYAGYCTEVWFEQATTFIPENAGRPFVAYLATNAPHSPYLLEERYAAPYRMNDLIPHPACCGMITNIDEQRVVRGEGSEQFKRSIKRWRSLLRKGCVAAVIRERQELHARGRYSKQQCYDLQGEINYPHRPPQNPTRPSSRLPDRYHTAGMHPGPIVLLTQ